ncbi:MAG: protein translocase subunit SecF [Rhizobiales bacterium]|nr:protein translocase subunit SecF [Hyphomicrobiales bacterium]MBI3673213.1 protein translocase subunit SecF [Hyphomicrobiales bacterium]
MAYRPIRFIPDDTKIPFMRLSRFGFFVSGLLSLAAVLLFVFVGLNYGVDFKGGTVLSIRTAQPANIEELRGKIDTLGFGGAEIQEFGSPNDVLIRLPAVEGGDKAQQDAVAKVKEALGPGIEFRSVEVVGPKVSGELTEQGIIAVVTAIIAIMIYVWFRFEWQFAMGAVLSLLHDVLITIGLFALLRIEFNLQIIAAILTIVGYSLNDTVVVFDRTREYLRKYKSMPLADLIDFSLNSVLPRTILTSVTTMLALIALYVFGGEVLRGFTFTMIWGVIVGTYSSIFIASPVLILLGTVRENVKQGAKAAVAARP